MADNNKPLLSDADIKKMSEAMGGVEVSKGCYDITQSHDVTTQLVGSGCKQTSAGKSSTSGWTRAY